MTNCGWIFEWGDPSKDCGLELHHESPHGQQVREATVSQKIDIANFVLECLKAGCTAGEIIRAIAEGKDTRRVGG